MDHKRINHIKTNLIEKSLKIWKILKIDFQNFHTSSKASKSTSQTFLGSLHNKISCNTYFMKYSERDISQCILALRNPKKHVAVQNLSTYDAWKYIRKQSKNNKLKIKLQHGMMNLNYEMALTLCPIFKIILSGSKIKIQETLTTIPPIHVYINRVNNRSVLKIKDGYKLELQTPETMKLISTTKKINRPRKNWRKSVES